MTTITKANGYKVEFNGKYTYFLLDSTKECLGYFDTERKAKNALRTLLREAGK